MHRSLTFLWLFSSLPCLLLLLQQHPAQAFISSSISTQSIVPAVSGDRRRRHCHHHGGQKSWTNNNALPFARRTPPSLTRTTTSSSSSVVILSALPAIPISFSSPLITCGLPTCLGYIRSEYGVSYAYGGAVAWTAWVMLQSLLRTGATTGGHWPLAAWHVLALVFYGCRLNVFLGYREMTSQRIQAMRKRIEVRAQSRGNRWQRTPFLASCALLYYSLCAPLSLSASALSSTMATTTLPSSSSLLLFLLLSVWKGLVGLTWLGFLVAAAGDLNKTWVKSRNGNEDYLVTEGLYRYIRHPNYTGEMVGWTSNALAGLVAWSMVVVQQGWRSSSALLTLSNIVRAVASVMGAGGMIFVLRNATRNLERKQEEMYGSSQKYQRWIRSSWRGFG